MTKQSNTEIIDFVKQTTVAITTISESTKQLTEMTGGIKEMIANQNIVNVRAFEAITQKQDGLMTMFKYVIVPLIGLFASLVGVKYLFKL